MGGWSAEREVSLVSGQAAVEALRARGWRVSAIDVGRDLPARLAELRPDVVYNALHGRYGEDGTVQGLLEIMGIPYSHSGVLASSLAMNKAMAKRLFAGAGLRCAEGVLTTVERVARRRRAAGPALRGQAQRRRLERRRQDRARRARSGRSTATTGPTGRRSWSSATSPGAS